QPAAPESVPVAAPVAVPDPPSPAPADEEPTLLVRKTLRSGQKVIFAGNVVVMGDVNPGAEIEAEGDVLVLGTLRGRAHAGCSGRNESQVVALVMQPTQLRIGDEVWVPEHNGKRSARPGPMRAVLQQGKLLTQSV
ncbi:MAG: septum site-determining protein MinC, partial [Candidatus Eremiobacterota bacterium]